MNDYIRKGDHYKKLQDITVANDRLYKEAAIKCNESPKQVEECVDVVSKFLSMIITRAAFETVMLPRFGKFRVKTKRLQGMVSNQDGAVNLPKLEPKKIEL